MYSMIPQNTSASMNCIQGFFFIVGGFYGFSPMLSWLVMENFRNQIIVLFLHKICSLYFITLAYAGEEQKWQSQYAQFALVMFRVRISCSEVDIEMTEAFRYSCLRCFVATDMSPLYTHWRAPSNPGTDKTFSHSSFLGCYAVFIGVTDFSKVVWSLGHWYLLLIQCSIQVHLNLKPGNILLSHLNKVC
jgi:hypothetical protein